MQSFREFATDYYAQFAAALQDVDLDVLHAIEREFVALAERGGTLYIAGNGGSAAISDHTTCDTTKGTHVDGHPAIRSISLAANGPMLTALANDIEYAEVFSKQLEFYLADEDAVLLVSSSGNSENVVRACRVAIARGVPTIAFVGFDGGRLRELARHCIWIPVHNYGIVEDTHQSLIHVLTQYVRQAREQPPEASA